MKGEVMSPMPKRKMLLVFNPRSGTQNFPDHLFDAVNKFTAAGFIVTVYPTQAPGEVGRIVADCAGGHDCLVCSGGDGTIGEAIDALMSLKKRPAFGVIPSGTINDFASSLGIPKDIGAASDIIAGASPKALDVGKFDGKHFSYVAAFGMFTDVPYATTQNAKNLLGKLAYFFEGVKRFAPAESLRCEFELDGQTVAGDFALGIIGNGSSIAGIKLPTEMGARMDDGLFEVILVRKAHSLKEHQEIISALLTQETTELLTIRKASKITFRSAKPVAWTLDGDFGGEYTAANIENLHHAIEVIVPTKTKR